MRRSFGHAWRLARGNRVLRFLIGAMVLATALLLLSGFLLAKQTTDTCSAALKVRDAMVAILVDAQERTNSVPAETALEKERQAANDFYAASIARLRGADCTS